MGNPWPCSKGIKMDGKATRNDKALPKQEGKDVGLVKPTRSYGLCPHPFTYLLERDRVYNFITK